MRFDRIASRLDDVMSKMSGLPGLSGLTLPSAFSANGGIPIVYKAIVVTVMAIVACGTLVTFGTAGAQEVPQARSGSQIPAASEANPVVEGQPLPPGLDPSLFASSPLLSTIDLTDAASASDFGIADDDDDGSDSSNTTKKQRQKQAAKKAAKRSGVAPVTRKNGQSGSGGSTNDGGSKGGTDGKSGGSEPTSNPTTQPPPPPPSPEPAPTTEAPTKRECVKREPLTGLCLKWSS